MIFLKAMALTSYTTMSTFMDVTETIQLSDPYHNTALYCKVYTFGLAFSQNLHLSVLAMSMTFP